MTEGKARARAEVARTLQALIPALILDNDRIARAVGLSMVDNQILHALSLAGRPLDQTELGLQTQQPSSTVSRAVDRLESAGYVRRTKIATDRRRFAVEPVADKLAHLHSHYAHVGRALDEVSEAFSAEELEVVARYLGRLGDARGLQAEPQG